jgi:sugar/nucleoside kinase (ribokinase family)
MTSNPHPVLTFGEALVGYGSPEADLRSAMSFTRFPGGAELNVAVGLSRLGVPTTWVSVLGDDAHGDYLLDAVAEFGVTTRVHRANGPTALMFKAGGASDDPQVLQIRHDSAFARHAQTALVEDLIAMRGVRHLHLTGIVLGVSAAARATALALLSSAAAASVTVSFDPNLRLNLWPDRAEMLDIVNQVAARADIVLPGISEGRLLTGRSDPRAIAQFYLHAGAREVAVKLGADGAQCWNANGSTARSRPIEVDPIDTVGAGDGFAAGYIAAFLEGGSLQDRVDLGAAVGALVTTRRGDLTAMPFADEVRHFTSGTAAQTAARRTANPRS